MVVQTKKSQPKFTELNELASENNGGRILFATDDWFACAENLLKDEEPVFKEGLFTDSGKWMDGWETRRKRCEGHDWAIIGLRRPSRVVGICIDTGYFTGNYAPRFSIQGSRLGDQDAKLFPKRNGRLGTAASRADFDQIQFLNTEKWETLIEMTRLEAGYPETRFNYFNINNIGTWTHLRLNIFPDGGIARLRLFGFATPEWTKLDSEELVDLISGDNGAVCEGYSDAHYGHPRNLIKPGRGINMGDGWETARRLDRPPILRIDDSGILRVPGSEWASFKLAHPGEIREIEIDTNHFKGNYPDSIEIEGAYERDNKRNWKTIMPSKKLSPHRQHFYGIDDFTYHGPISHVRLIIRPDGGISRVRILGYIISH